MGKMFRCYWIPALLAEELAGERMPAGAREAAVRAPAGLPRQRRALRPDRRILSPTAASRCGSAATRKSGLRCPYHGWKYDVTGQCIEVPSEPVGVRLLQEDQADGPIRWSKRGGVLWTYMGPPEQQPPLPEWEFATVPGQATASSPSALQECNWLQAMEGGIDLKPRLVPAFAANSIPIRCSRAPRATNTISTT